MAHHVHKPEDGPCGVCGDASTCPMVYCPQCPTVCPTREAEAREARIATEQGAAAARLVAAAAEAGTYGRPEGPTVVRAAVKRAALGRMVHVLVHPTINNGSDVAPAVITRVWGPSHMTGAETVNLRVFLDGTNHSHEWATSRLLWQTEQRARQEVRDLNDRLLAAGAEEVHPLVSGHAFWPALT